MCGRDSGRISQGILSPNFRMNAVTDLTLTGLYPNGSGAHWADLATSQRQRRLRRTRHGLSQGRAEFFVRDQRTVQRIRSPFRRFRDAAPREIARFLPVRRSFRRRWTAHRSAANFQRWRGSTQQQPHPQQRSAGQNDHGTQPQTPSGQPQRHAEQSHADHFRSVSLLNFKQISKVFIPIDSSLRALHFFFWVRNDQVDRTTANRRKLITQSHVLSWICGRTLLRIDSQPKDWK